MDFVNKKNRFILITSENKDGAKSGTVISIVRNAKNLPVFKKGFFNFAAKIDEYHMKDLLEQAALQLQQQQFEGAISTYRQVLEQDPENIVALANISSAYLRLQQFEKALEHLNLAIQLQPDNSHLYSERGVAYFLNNQISESLSDLDLAQSLEPENPYRYSSRAFVRDKAGDTKGAIADYEKAIALDPEDAIAHNNLGLVQEKAGYKDKAQQNFARADALEGRATPPPMPAINPQKEKNSAQKTKPGMSLKYYGSVLQSVLTSRAGFKEFLDFLKRKK